MNQKINVYIWDEVFKYTCDPLCGFTCSMNFYKSFLGGVFNTKDKFVKNNLNKFILIVSGTSDLVGYNGDGLRSYINYLKIQYEILNETNKEEVYEYILGWIDNNIKNRT